MKKRVNKRREARAQKHSGNIAAPDNFIPYEQVRKEPPPLRALNQAQYDYIKAIDNNTITFGIGPAGTGKSYVSVSKAAQLLKDGDIEKIIITRPGVEAGEEFGFLPGTLEEKFSPYLDPVIDILHERLGKTYTQYLIKTGGIQGKPLAFMRGSTFKDAFVILDEAQNCTKDQMKMFLTRIGNNCKVVIDGDISQKDICGMSGLHDAVNRLRYIPNVSVVDFDMDDCVRSGICRDILLAYQ